jgi:hypothetical protein
MSLPGRAICHPGSGARDGHAERARPDEPVLQQAALMLRSIDLPFRIIGVRGPSPEKEGPDFIRSVHPL